MLLHSRCSVPSFAMTTTTQASAKKPLLGATKAAPARRATTTSRHHQRRCSTSSLSSLSSSPPPAFLSAVAARAAARPPSLAGDWRDLRIRHVVESQQFSRECMDLVFDTAREMESVAIGTPAARQLEGRVMATLFYEPSTRTRLSFESAMARLGGTVLSTESAGEYSSAAKGETLEDTIRTVEGYCDCIVLRHFQAGSARAAASVSAVPLLNAGDGPGQHPTQALLDVYTIRRELGSLENGVRVALVGDLANGRTARSLAYLLSSFPNVSFVFVAPPVVRMGDDIKQFLDERGVPWSESSDLASVASRVDVLYQTRIQKERFRDRPQDYESAKGKFIVDAAVMSALPESSIVMHPLPRVDEIVAAEVDSDPRAAYFRQAKNGLFVRMALLKLALLK